MSVELSDELYQRFRDLLLARCGLHYPERKRADLAHGLGLALSASRSQRAWWRYMPMRSPAGRAGKRSWRI